jgi:hypothetical protein
LCPCPAFTPTGGAQPNAAVNIPPGTAAHP